MEKLKDEVQTYSLTIERLGFRDFQINKVYVLNSKEMSFNQILIDYSAGSVGTRGWGTKSYMYLITWGKYKYKIAFEHLLKLEKHYDYDTSEERYLYEFVTKGNKHYLRLLDNNMNDEVYVWNINKFSWEKTDLSSANLSNIIEVKC